MFDFLFKKLLGTSHAEQPADTASKNAVSVDPPRVPKTAVEVPVPTAVEVPVPTEEVSTAPATDNLSIIAVISAAIAAASGRDPSSFRVVSFKRANNNFSRQ